MACAPAPTRRTARLGRPQRTCRCARSHRQAARPFAECLRLRALVCVVAFRRRCAAAALQPQSAPGTQQYACDTCATASAGAAGAPAYEHAPAQRSEIPRRTAAAASATPSRARTACADVSRNGVNAFTSAAALAPLAALPLPDAAAAAALARASQRGALRSVHSKRSAAAAPPAARGPRGMRTRRVGANSGVHALGRELGTCGGNLERKRNADRAVRSLLLHQHSVPRPPSSAAQRTPWRRARCS